MRALGELVLHRPTSGAFVSYMREFFGEKAAFVTGWLYWLNWGLTGIAELSAVGLYVQYWFPTDADLGDRADRAGRGAGRSTCCRRARSASSSSGPRSLKVGAIVVFLVVGPWSS